MRCNHDKRCANRVAGASSAVVALLMLGVAPAGFAQQPEPQNFPSAEAASGALVAAVRHHDGMAVMMILGAGQEVTHEDDVEDRLLHERFVGKYEQMHRLVREPNGTMVLYIGAENWPFPVPLVSTNGAWHFDASAGLMEVLFRRIGENEAMAVQFCQALLTGDAGDTAWSNGVLAVAPSDAKPAPYYGYYFRVLPPPGQNGGGRATGKPAAIVAYPAKYRSSGVMTFMVGRAYAYEKDLGLDTAQLAGAITAYNPDPSWKILSQEP